MREVDEKLVMLGRQMNAPILTNDFNLNRVAELQGVHVLNINELGQRGQIILLPGEALHVRVIQEGKESGQGVGYLDDGTMVVVEEGREYHWQGDQGVGDQSAANSCWPHDLFQTGRKEIAALKHRSIEMGLRGL